MLIEVKEDSYGWVNIKVRCVEYNKALASKSNFTESKDESNERNFYFTISKSVRHPAIWPHGEKTSCTHVIIHWHEREDQRVRLKPTGSSARLLNQMLYEREWLLNSNPSRLNICSWTAASYRLREVTAHLVKHLEYLKRTALSETTITCGTSLT